MAPVAGQRAALMIDGESLTVADVVAVAREGRPVDLLPHDSLERMTRSASWVQQVVREDRMRVYGVNTGFGHLVRQRIGFEDTRTLSYNVVVSSAAGVDKPFPEDVVRAAMLIRANSLAKGLSGIRPVVVNTLIQMLNAGVTPVVPSKGSVGASGDLAPLAHISMVLCEPPPGKPEDGGMACYRGEILSGREAMARAGIPRIVLEAKEGLALTNGATMTAGIASLAVHDAWNLVRSAEVALAMTLEALCGFTDAFDARPHRARGYPGQQETAANVRKLIEGSGLVNALPDRIQDAYSVRCAPQVLGAVRDALRFITSTVSTEINAAADNPLIFMDLPRENKAISAGNFHGEPLAFAMDLLGIVTAEVASISERRVFRLTNPALSDGLPCMLVTTPGLNSGYMVPHCTAAALVSDNKTLAHPDSVDSIPTSADQEDHVSMCTNAARHATEIVRNSERVVAIEILSATQALDLRPAGTRRSPAADAVHRLVRQRVPPMQEDRSFSAEMEHVAGLVHSGAILSEVAASSGQSAESYFA